MSTTTTTYKDAITIFSDIISNTVKMLKDRKWIKEENVNKRISDLISKKNDDMIYIIDLDIDLNENVIYEVYEDKSKWKKFDGKKVALYLTKHKLTGKAPSINAFIETHINMHKIIVVEYFNDKGKQTVMTQTSNRCTEIFIESDLMIDLFSHKLSPKYEVLTMEEAEDARAQWKVSKKQLPFLLENDRGVRNLYIKSGQMIRIIQNSIMTGESVEYRIVVRAGTVVSGA